MVLQFQLSVMKLLVVLAVAVALCAGSPSPIGPPGDNSHYVEGESQYIWMPDGEGVPHLVDLWAKPSEEDLLEAVSGRNGALNNYWLFTRQNPTARQVIVNGNANTIWASNYLGSRPLKVVVHGWNSSGTSAMNPLITAAFLAVMDCNVIVVDWGAVANNVNYWGVVQQVPDVGRHIGNFVNWLINTAGGNWNNTHFVGFSLGAHAVGNAGRQVGNRVRRVTGLDPAGPNWGGNANALRASDGGYVEIIHTDGGSLGINDPIGNTNFYPNGGRNAQPGCWVSTCSHGRAPEFFAATVHHNHLIGRLCNNLSDANANRCTGGSLHMGNSILTKNGNGLYALTTGANWPF